MGKMWERLQDIPSVLPYKHACRPTRTSCTVKRALALPSRPTASHRPSIDLILVTDSELWTRDRCGWVQQRVTGMVYAGVCVRSCARACSCYRARPEFLGPAHCASCVELALVDPADMRSNIRPDRGDTVGLGRRSRWGGCPDVCLRRM